MWVHCFFLTLQVAEIKDTHFPHPSWQTHTHTLSMEHKRAVAPTWRWRSHVVVDKTTSPQTGQFVVDKKHNQELKSLSHLRLDHACAMGTSSVGEHAVVIAAAKTIFCVRTMQFKKPSGSPVLWHHPVQGTTQGLHWLDQMRVLRAYDDGGGRGAISVLRAPISAPTQEMFFDALSGTHKTLIQSLAINTFDVGQVITGAQDGSVLALDLNHGGGCVLEQTQHKGAITSLLLPDDCNCGVCPSFTVGDNQGSFRVADLRQGLRHLGFEASMGQPVRQHVRLDHHQVVLSGLQGLLLLHVCPR